MLSELNPSEGFSKTKGTLLNINDKKGANNVMEKIEKTTERILKREITLNFNL